jgi:hypothetical protein
MIRRAISCILSLIAITMIGCDGGSDSEMLPVTGTVKNADGSVVTAEEGGQVLFNPDGSGAPASGSIEKDGTFAMMTGQSDGVKPGKYKVVLQLWKNYRAETLAVPEKYGDAETTPLEATVDADNVHFDFVVEP